MSSAVLGLGTQLQLCNDATPSTSSIFTTVAEVKGIGVEGGDRDVIDVTSHDSVAPAREFIAGLLDGAVIQCQLNFLPANATHTDLTTNIKATSSIFRTYRIAWSDFGATSLTGTVNTGTDAWTTSTHGWITGQPIRFSSTVALPASTPQIIAGRTYFAKTASSTTFKVYETAADAAADTNAINFTGTGSGTHTVTGGTSWTFSAMVTGFNATAEKSSPLSAAPKFKITNSFGISP